jgi:hypothetical protein
MNGIPQGWKHQCDADEVHLAEAVPVITAEGSDWVEDSHFISLTQLNSQTGEEALMPRM